MLPIAWIEHLVYMISHHWALQYGLKTVCHFHRAHTIAPAPGHKWVQVARISCRILAPSSWYRQP